MKRASLSAVAGLGLAATALAMIAPGDARACGGFFVDETEVSTSATVDQSAVRMVFEVGQSEVTAHVAVGYQGDAQTFAWVIPVPALPRDIDVSSTDMFEQLDRATAPRFTRIEQGESSRGGGCGIGCGGAAGGDKAGGLEDGLQGSGVTVWSRQNVGPFATEVVSSEDPGAMRAWLVAGGYAIPEVAEPALTAYVSAGSFFLAMRLQEAASVEDIAPIRFTYSGTEPCVPLRMDAISAPDDLPLLVWIFASARAVPSNWAQTEPDWSRLVFDEESSNYLDLVTQAVDATGGQSFVTEYAGETRFLGRVGEYGGSVELTDPTLVAMKDRASHVTRLFTTVSPEEMTVDPIFRLDDAASDVSNEHVWEASLGVVPRRGTRGDETATAFALVVAGVGWRSRRRRRAA